MTTTTTAPRFANGVEVTVTGVTVDSPKEVFNGRTGIVVDSRRIGAGHVELVTVHFDYPVTADEIDLMFDGRGTLADVTEDPTGHRVDFLASLLAPKAALLDPAGREFDALVHAALLEVRGMARRGGGELWTMARELVTAPWLKANLPYTITTAADARAWLHHKAATDAFGF